jgi:phage baseplate assembly protein W
MELNRPYRLYKDIDLAFTKNPLTWDVNKKIDVNAVKQSLKTLIFTRYNERLFQPDLGSPVYKLLFEPIDPITTESIRKSIESLIQNHEPRVIMNQLDVVPAEDENSYEITLFFTVVGIPLPVSFSTILQRLR